MIFPSENRGKGKKCNADGDKPSAERAKNGFECGDGDVSPFSALTTALAATIGTGNIVGVATAMVSGGPGALVWMWISACFGLTSKFSECMLAIKYRERNEKGEMSGGPMYTMKKALPKGFGAVLGWLFALFAVLASFGIGNMTQANSISSALNETVGFSKAAIGVVLTILSLAVIVGGIKSISKVSSVVVPLMAVFYIIAGIIVIIGNIQNIPAGLVMIFKYAFTPQAVTGGVLGNVVASMMAAMQYGIARGCFSNEAGMGSAAITAAAATTDHPVRQAYINMTGTFWDTIVVCSITGLCIASSGMLGQIDPATGSLYTGSALTIASFLSAGLLTQCTFDGVSEISPCKETNTDGQKNTGAYKQDKHSGTPDEVIHFRYKIKNFFVAHLHLPLSLLFSQTADKEA